MTDESLIYIVTPHVARRPERIDALLARRMKDFLLARRQKIWREGSDE